MRERTNRKWRAAAVAAILLFTGAIAGLAQPNTERSGTATAPGTATGGAAEVGVLVVSVDPGSPAEKAGITRGDIILSADGKDVADVPQLLAILEAHKSGDTISLKVKHGDAERALSVILGVQKGVAYLGIVPYGYRVLNSPRMMTGALPQGANVATVTPGGPAEKAGIKPGDTIESVDAVKVGARQDLRPLILAHKAGDVVTLSVRTPGQSPRDVKVTLEKNPQADTVYLGIEYTIAGGAVGSLATGALVRDVADNSPAAKAGLKPQDLITAIDGVPVSTPNAVADAVASHKPGDTLTLTVYRFSENKEVQVVATLDKAPDGQGSGAYLGVTIGRIPEMRRQANPLNGPVI
jgi:S1-C subfamily serine protease